MPWRENKGVANLNGIKTDILGLRERKKSWRKSFLRMAVGQKLLWIHGRHGGHGWLMSRER